MSTVIRRLWQRIQNSTYYIGRDLEGNSFFEYPPHMNGDPSRTKRVVKYAQGRDMWHYVAGNRRLAVQWSSWLSHTRPHPPTIEELHADLERQRRVLAQAALIDARDREESARLKSGIEQEPKRPAVPAPKSIEEGIPLYDATSGAAVGPSQKVIQDVPPHGVEDAARDTGDYYPPTPDEPLQWTPQTVRRGG